MATELLLSDEMPPLEMVVPSPFAQSEFNSTKSVDFNDFDDHPVTTAIATPIIIKKETKKRKADSIKSVKVVKEKKAKSKTVKLMKSDKIKRSGETKQFVSYPQAYSADQGGTKNDRRIYIRERIGTLKDKNFDEYKVDFNDLSDLSDPSRLNNFNGSFSCPKLIYEKQALVAVTTKCLVFAKLLSALSVMFVDVNFLFKPEGIKITEVEDEGKCFVSVHLLSDKFLAYYCPQSFSMNHNLATFADKFKKVKKVNFLGILSVPAHDQLNVELIDDNKTIPQTLINLYPHASVHHQQYTTDKIFPQVEPVKQEQVEEQSTTLSTESNGLNPTDGAAVAVSIDKEAVPAIEVIEKKRTRKTKSQPKSHPKPSASVSISAKMAPEIGMDARFQFRIIAPVEKLKEARAELSKNNRVKVMSIDLTRDGIDFRLGEVHKFYPHLPAVSNDSPDSPDVTTKSYQGGISVHADIEAGDLEHSIKFDFCYWKKMVTMMDRIKTYKGGKVTLFFSRYHPFISVIQEIGNLGFIRYTLSNSSD